MQSSGRDLIVGLFVLAGIAAISYLSLQVAGLSYGSGPSMQLTAVFDDIGGLKVRAPVSVSGVRIGQVRAIGLADDLRARVTVEVGADVELSVDTQASIRTAGLLGDQFIALEPGAEDDTLGDGDQFEFTTSAFSIDRLIGSLVHGNTLGGEE